MTNSDPLDRSATSLIRPVRDAEQVAWQGAPPLRGDAEGPRWRRTLLAEQDNQVVGVVTMQLSPVTECYFCEVHVHPGHRRQGIGTELYRAACAVLEHPYRVQARAMASQPLRRAFAESLGCEVLRHCPEPWADPTAPAWQQWVADQPVPPGHTTHPLGQTDPDAVQQAWTRYYRWAHEEIGPVRVEHLARAWERYRAGLDPTTSTTVVSAEDHRVVAFCLVSAEPWDGRLLAVSETADRDQHGGVALVEAAVAGSLRQLGADGITRVELEGHSTDPHLPRVLAGFPPHESDPMDMLAVRRW